MSDPLTLQSLDARLKRLEATINPERIKIGPSQDVRRLKDIVGTVASYFAMKEKLLISPSREKQLAFPRFIAMGISRKYTQNSFHDIAKALGGRSHETVLMGERRCIEMLESEDKRDNKFKCDYLLIESVLCSAWGITQII